MMHRKRCRAPMDGPEVERIHRVREKLFSQFKSMDEMSAFLKKLEKKRGRNIEMGRRSLAERDAEWRREVRADARRQRKAAAARRSA